MTDKARNIRYRYKRVGLDESIVTEDYSVCPTHSIDHIRAFLTLGIPVDRARTDNPCVVCLLEASTPPPL